MKILMDTHVLLWLAFDEKHKLSPLSVALLDDFANELYFSLVSLWEIAIKSGLGKSDFAVDAALLHKGLLSVGCRELPIQLPHITQSAALPMLHKDPFDRLLLAQAQVENLHFLSADARIHEYGLPFIIKA
ncbi:PIN domain nuclease of toxin-antitoxin system [Neisseria sp. HSC-16F19]|nr:type II toxin-antitoxin system VapC family toxin [Neisseria sp. HSC-16F19]MCP2040772.1 PIN domain nuclease of toxin-antitoxin system [Neisseria sp. HSC-16F19]